MKLYKQYCYSGISDVKKSIESELYLSDFGLIDSVTSLSGVVSINYTRSDLSTGTFFFSPPNCTQLGFDNSFFGIDSVDAVLLGTEVSIVLLLAWGIKILRRAI